jgi:hypothetical protein
MKNLTRTVDFGLAVWALRGAFIAGKLTPMGAILLLPTAITLARDGIGLAREGAQYLKERKRLKSVIKSVH